jgi:hypothetical protein
MNRLLTSLVQLALVASVIYLSRFAWADLKEMWRESQK